MSKTITLATFVKNEENCIEHMIKSAVDHVDEIIVIDTGSTDKTIEICKKYEARIYEVGFTDFGKIRTLAAHMSRMDWVLMLDADETIEDPEMLQAIIRIVDPNIDPEDKEKTVEAVAFPRRRWLDLEMTQQVELEAYPDWQVRFFENKTIFGYKRALHEEFHGGAVTHIKSGPTIHHFQDVFKDKEANRRRRKLYEKLATVAGVEVHGGKVVGSN